MSDCAISKNLQHKKRTLRRIQDLDAAELLQQNIDRGALDDVAQKFEIGVSAHVQNLIGDDITGPIAQQYIPSEKELYIAKDEMSDPIGDDVYTPVKGVVHRYPDRVLLKATSLCAVYCRYCFRKEMLGADAGQLSDEDMSKALSYIDGQKDVWEVILTGGDPFILSPRRLARILNALACMNHVKTLRIHSRIPVADPLKITETHLSVLKSFNKSIQVVIHINHVNEISETVRSAILKLQRNNCLILSQSVLLKGVNDDPNALASLFKGLMQLNVAPYYLHHLDRAKGSSHFRVKIEDGMRIMRDLQGHVSGTVIPKYVLDIPGGHGKIPLTRDYVEVLGESIYRIKDYQGGYHIYTENASESMR